MFEISLSTFFVIILLACSFAACAMNIMPKSHWNSVTCDEKTMMTNTDSLRGAVFEPFLQKTQGDKFYRPVISLFCYGTAAITSNDTARRYIFSCAVFAALLLVCYNLDALMRSWGACFNSRILVLCCFLVSHHFSGPRMVFCDIGGLIGFLALILVFRFSGNVYVSALAVAAAVFSKESGLALLLALLVIGSNAERIAMVVLLACYIALRKYSGVTSGFMVSIPHYMHTVFEAVMQTFTNTVWLMKSGNWNYYTGPSLAGKSLLLQVPLCIVMAHAVFKKRVTSWYFALVMAINYLIVPSEEYNNRAYYMADGAFMLMFAKSMVA